MELLTSPKPFQLARMRSVGRDILLQRQKHKDEVIAKMMTDKVCKRSYQQFMDLIAHGSM
jgi:hypothetical protein